MSSHLEHVQAKWTPVRRQNVLETKTLERVLDSGWTEPALGAIALGTSGGR